MATYSIKYIDDTLWARVQTRTRHEGRTIKFVVEELLRGYADFGYDVMITELREQATPAKAKKG